MKVEGYSAKFCGTVFSFLNILLDPDFFVLLLVIIRDHKYKLRNTNQK